jgi:hypothetical protein
MIYCPRDLFYNIFFSKANKNVPSGSGGSGSVINWPSAYVNQDYGSKDHDPDPEEIVTDPQDCINFHL